MKKIVSLVVSLFLLFSTVFPNSTFADDLDEKLSSAEITEYGGDKIFVLLEPNYASQVSVTLNSNGNFTYAICGDEEAWQTTREF